MRNPYYQCPTLTKAASPRPHSVALVYLTTGWLKFNNKHASACRLRFSSAHAAVGAAVQSSADFLHRCNGLFVFFLLLAHSGLKLATIFPLPPIAGITRHAPSHLALWRLGESYMPQNTCYSGSRAQMLAYENLPPKVQLHKCAGSFGKPTRPYHFTFPTEHRKLGFYT